MKRFQSILCASLLAVALASTAFAGNITTRSGNITTKGGNITTKDGNITTKDGNITTLTDYILVALASIL